MSELRECPCCPDGTAERQFVPGRYAIYCNRCGLATRWYRSQQEAEAAWNYRSAAAGPWRPMTEMITGQWVFICDYMGGIWRGLLMDELIVAGKDGAQTPNDYWAWMDVELPKGRL